MDTAHPIVIENGVKSQLSKEDIKLVVTNTKFAQHDLSTVDLTKVYY
jgi:NACalpha-BTF3-like transcription factor